MIIPKEQLIIRPQVHAKIDQEQNHESLKLQISSLVDAKIEQIRRTSFNLSSPNVQTVVEEYSASLTLKIVLPFSIFIILIIILLLCLIYGIKINHRRMALIVNEVRHLHSGHLINSLPDSNPDLITLSEPKQINQTGTSLHTESDSVQPKPNSNVKKSDSTITEYKKKLRSANKNEKPEWKC